MNLNPEYVANVRMRMLQFSVFSLLVIFILIVITSLYQPFFLIRVAQKIFPRIIFYVPTNENVFALTFDDGPNPPITDQIMDILDKYDAKATFFLSGDRVAEHSEYIENYGKRGHQIANHSNSAEPTLFQSEQQFAESLELAESLIEQDSTFKMFRPASGWIRPGLLDVAEEKGFTVVLGSAYVSDPKNLSKSYMLGALKSMLRPGIIIVLHDGGDNREDVISILPDLLEFAKEKDLRAVTLREMMSDMD